MLHNLSADRSLIMSVFFCERNRVESIYGTLLQKLASDGIICQAANTKQCQRMSCYKKISPTTSKTKQWVCDWETERRDADSFTSCILGLATPNLRCTLYKNVSFLREKTWRVHMWCWISLKCYYYYFNNALYLKLTWLTLSWLFISLFPTSLKKKGRLSYIQANMVFI